MLSQPSSSLCTLPQDGLLCRVGQETSSHSFYTPKENFRVTLTLVGVTLGWVSLYIYGLIKDRVASLFHYFYKELIKDKNVECLANPRVGGEPLSLYFQRIN